LLVSLLATGTLPPALHTLSLHDALPIWHVSGSNPLRARSPDSRLTRVSSGRSAIRAAFRPASSRARASSASGSSVAASPTCSLRSEEHTSELQSPYDLVCRLLLEKKNII